MFKESIITKKLILIHILFLLSFNTYGQDSTIKQDILQYQTQLSTLTHDTARARIHAKLAIIYKNNVKYDSAIQQANQGLLLVDQNKQPRLVNSFYRSISQAYILSGRYDLAIKYLQKQLAYAQQHLTISTTGIYNDLSVVYYYKGEYYTAVTYSLKTVKIYEEAENNERLLSSYNNLGHLYHKVQQYDKALQTLHKTIHLSYQLESTNIRSRAFNNIGLVFTELQQYDSALFYLYQAERLKIANKSTSISSTYHSISKVLRSQGNYAQALSYLKQALSMNQQYQNQNGIIHDLLEIANCYLEMQDYQQAAQYYDQALSIARKTESLDLITEIQLKRSELFTQIKSFRASLSAYREANQLKDSLNNLKRMKEWAEVHALYEVEKREQALAKAKVELALKDTLLSKERWIQITGGIGLIIFIILSYLLWQRYRTLKILSEQTIQNLQNALTHTEATLIAHKKERDQIAQQLAQNKDNKQLQAQLDQSEQEIQDLELFYDLRKQIQQTFTSKSSENLEVHQLKEMISSLFIEKKHQKLIQALQEKFPSLTEDDLRLCAAIKQRLLNTEIAMFLQVSTNTLYTRKTRLKQKLQLDPKAQLNDFILQYPVA